MCVRTRVGENRGVSPFSSISNLCSVYFGRNLPVAAQGTAAHIHHFSITSLNRAIFTHRDLFILTRLVREHILQLSLIHGRQPIILLFLLPFFL